MLLLARCNNDCTAQCKDQWRKYAKVEYIEYTKDVVYVAKGKYDKSTPKEIPSVEEGHNKPLTKEGLDEPLAKDGNWLSTTMSPLPQGQLTAYVMQDDDEHLATRTWTSCQATINRSRVTYALQGNNEPS